MRVSVVINTYNRAPTLAVTLEALRWQEHRDFEVIVVDGPSDDGTPELLAERGHELRALRFEGRHLAQSRNLGVDAAAGDVVAFIDDDAIPEPRWLSDLVAGYATDAIAGVGGVVLDESGVRSQFRFCSCDRLGRQDFDIAPPFDGLVVPGADPFLYLTGGNNSFRRAALERIGGFDEEIEYNYEDADVCLRLIDAGLALHAVDAARVHHLGAPSHLRRSLSVSLDPFVGIKNRAYFAVSHGRAVHGLETVIGALTQHMTHLRAVAQDARDRGELSPAEHDHFRGRLEAGFELGVHRGLAGVPRTRPIAPADREAFLPYAVRRAERRLRTCFITADYPPAASGGIPRYTQDLATALAAEGHEIHVVTRGDDSDRITFEQGVWVHRHPEGARFVPELDGHPAGAALTHMAAVYRAVARIDAEASLDVVCGPLWAAEPLLCAADPRLPLVVTCMTPMREVAASAPTVGERPESGWQIRFEALLVQRADRLHAISQAILDDVRAAGATDVPADVLGLGVPDRAGAFPRRRGDDGVVEILFAGRLEPRKGVDVLLEAVAPLLHERPEVQLRLIGPDTGFATGGERYGDRFAREVGSDRVRFDGEVSDDELWAAYADCDIFCAPSRYESFGLVLAEAMSFARPVVTCAVGGTTEVIGETGVLVPPGNAGALRDALRSLVDDPERRVTLGAAGRRRYEEKFAADAVARKTAAILARATDDYADRPSAEAAERTVRAATAALVREVLEVPAVEAQRVAEALLEPAAFPFDAEAAVRRCGELADDEAFVRGVYEALLGREPEAKALVLHLDTIAQTGSRVAFVRDVAASDEGRARGIDPGLAARVVGIDPAAQLAATRRAWLHDDARFPEALAEALGVVGVAAAIREALPAGRETALRAALARPEVGARIASTSRAALLETTFDAAADLDARLLALHRAEAAHDGFVAGLYQLLLGRAIDPAGSVEMSRIMREGGTRADLVTAVAGSAEAAVAGIDPVWATNLAGRLPALAQRRRSLQHRLRQLRGGSPPAPPPSAPDHERLHRELLARLAGQSAQLDEMRDTLARERDARERAEAARTAEIAAAEARAVERAHEQVLRRHHVFGPPERLSIAPSAQVHDALFNTVSGNVTIGDNAFFGHGVAVLTGTHETSATGVDRKAAVPNSGRDVVIGEGAWIASRATIIGPCQIGPHAVVAAGAVVASDVPAGATVAGVPARVVRNGSS